MPAWRNRTTSTATTCSAAARRSTAGGWRTRISERGWRNTPGSSSILLLLIGTIAVAVAKHLGHEVIDRRVLIGEQHSGIGFEERCQTGLGNRVGVEASLE